MEVAERSEETGKFCQIAKVRQNQSCSMWIEMQRLWDLNVGFLLKLAQWYGIRRSELLELVLGLTFPSSEKLHEYSMWFVIKIGNSTLVVGGP